MEEAPTRTVLLELGNRIKLAKKGHSLLKRKQDALIRELLEYVRNYKQSREDVMSKVKDSYKHLSLAIAISGINVARSVSYGVHDVFKTEMKIKNIMGVKFPLIYTKKNGVDLSQFQSAPQVSHTAKKFHNLFEDLVRIARLRLAIYALAEEITKVKRRVNSLEHVQIPNLEARKAQVKFALGEIEREGFLRLKVVKERISAEEEY